MNIGIKYNLKVWLLSGAISFILCQFPIYYLYHDKFSIVGDSYLSLNLEVLKETLEAMCYLIIPWLVILLIVKRLYKPTWSLRQFKWVILLVSEFLIMFFLLDGISIFDMHLILPTILMLGIFALSTAISVYVCNVDDVFAETFRLAKELE